MFRCSVGALVWLVETAASQHSHSPAVGPLTVLVQHGLHFSVEVALETVDDRNLCMT